MPANVDSMFSVREMPWHREGQVLADYPGSWAEARVPAGLEWEAESSMVYELDGLDEEGRPTYRELPGWQRIYRSDTNATLSVAPNSYAIIGNADMGPIIEAVLETPNVKYETAGSLMGGRQVWCLCYLDEPITLPGDISVTLPYLAMMTRHEPGYGATLRATAVRVVCANTFRAAELEGERTGATFSFRHTSGWRERVEEARDAVTGARREIAAYADLARELLAVPLSAVQREQFVHAFIPEPAADIVTERVRLNIDEARRLLRNIFTSPTTEAVADTAYGAVQAAVEYLDHVRAARTWETKLGRTMLSREPLKARALTLVRSITSDAS